MRVFALHQALVDGEDVFFGGLTRVARGAHVVEGVMAAVHEFFFQEEGADIRDARRKDVAVPVPRGEDRDFEGVHVRVGCPAYGLRNQHPEGAGLIVASEPFQRVRQLMAGQGQFPYVLGRGEAAHALAEEAYGIGFLRIPQVRPAVPQAQGLDAECRTTQLPVGAAEGCFERVRGISGYPALVKPYSISRI